MKKILNIAALSIALMAGSCQKSLEEKPLASVSVDQFFRSAKDVEAAMAGIYSGFQQEMVGASQFNDRYHIWGEFRADNFTRSVTYAKNPVNEVMFNTLTPSNPWANWTGLYKVIGRANIAIKSIPNVKNYEKYDQNLENNNLAQAYAMRAMCYFYIVRVWGDAPIRTEPYTDLSENPNKPRDSKDKIFSEVIIPDLEKAYSLIQKDQTANVWYINEGAICAMLADVYMWKQDAPNAIKWIERLFTAKAPSGAVFAGTEVSLQPTATWKSLFTAPSSTRENIWSIHWDYTFNNCACMHISWTPNNKEIVIDPAIYNSWRTQTDDIRVKQTIDVFKAAPLDRVLKWYSTAVNPTAADPYPSTYQQLPVYLVMYRLGDIYLLYAEALNKNGDQAKALTYLNYIRKRAGLTPFTASSPEVGDGAVIESNKLENAILNERRLELFGEGKRWFDLVRTNKVDEVMDPVLTARQVENGSLETPGFDDPRKIYWPIHRNVFNANPEINQNDPYSN